MNSERFDPSLLEVNKSPTNRQLANSLGLHAKSLDKPNKYNLNSSQSYRYQKSSMDRLL